MFKANIQHSLHEIHIFCNFTAICELLSQVIFCQVITGICLLVFEECIKYTINWKLLFLFKMFFQLFVNQSQLQDKGGMCITDSVDLKAHDSLSGYSSQTPVQSD